MRIYTLLSSGTLFLLVFIAQKTRPRWSRVLFDLSFYLTILDVRKGKLLDELLTVLDNNALVVLIYLNTEEVLYSHFV